jgi:branched-chain amino acid transport system substrate-binding protein
MKRYQLFMLVLIVICITPSAWAGPEAKSPYRIGAVISVSGPNAPLGIPERDTLLLLTESINQSGGISGHPLGVLIEDDASDNTNAVKAAKQLIDGDKVCALIGSSGTGPTMAMVPITEASGVPHISMAAGNAITSPVKKWVFRVAPTDVLVAGKLLDYFSRHRIGKIAVIYESNAFGASGRDQLQNLAPRYKIALVAEESFATKDTDMTVQLTKIRATGAQAIVCWGTNPGPAQVAKDVQQLGITIPLFMSHGVADQTFLDQAGAAADGIILPAAKLVVAGELPASDPQKKVLDAYAKAFTAKYHRLADHYGGHAWDALHLVVLALGKVGDNRAQLRDEIERTHGYVGVGGIFRFSATDHDGLRNDACAMLKIVGGKWTLLQN